MSGFFGGPAGSRISFAEILASTKDAVAAARKTEAIATLHTRIKRCQELIVYIDAIWRSHCEILVISDEHKLMCIDHVLDELRDWNVQLDIEVTDFGTLGEIVIKVQAALMTNLKQLNAPPKEEPASE